MIDFQRKILSSNIELDDYSGSQISISLKREDTLDPFVSGNKFRKLKYNILDAKSLGYTKMLTFGGAYSNHIAAVAVAGKSVGLKTIGIIRGEELASNKVINPTLKFAHAHGMELHFVSRSVYRSKEESDYLQSLKETFGEFYLLPEGGTNTLAVKGCSEILTNDDKNFDYICTAVGTGGTIAGLINASEDHQTVLGFSALKGTFQKDVVEEYTEKTNFEIMDAYCFGGYAKIDSELVRFMNEFNKITGIPLDPVYTGKMMFGILIF